MVLGISISGRSGLAFAVAAISALALTAFGAGGAAVASAKTVKISGKAYVFNHMDTPISGATIKVREFPKISTRTDQFGDYRLRVPNQANVTPYILSGEGLLTRRSFADNSPTAQVQTHWNEIDLQTFHTRRADIENANFQSPADAEYAGLKALLRVPAREDGRPEQCAIVTTASARDVRGVDYHAFWENTPHGVPGATSIEYPAIDGPIYFNESVIPDRTKTETSEDGGIIWPVVPSGRYRIVTSAPGTRFASFLATCRPGRIINASPPWGAYQLKRGEKPLAASNVAARVQRVKAYRKGKRRFLAIRIRGAEKVAVAGNYESVRRPGVPGFAGVLVGDFEGGKAPTGTKVFRVRMPWLYPRSRVPLKIRIELTDASGVSFTSIRRVVLPKLKKHHWKRWKGRG